MLGCSRPRCGPGKPSSAPPRRCHSAAASQRSCAPSLPPALANGRHRGRIARDRRGGSAHRHRGRRAYGRVWRRAGAPHSAGLASCDRAERGRSTAMPSAGDLVPTASSTFPWPRSTSRPTLLRRRTPPPEPDLFPLRPELRPPTSLATQGCCRCRLPDGPVAAMMRCLPTPTSLSQGRARQVPCPRHSRACARPGLDQARSDTGRAPARRSTGPRHQHRSSPCGHRPR
mmetsp:Transcript_74975/g.160542  ORF Transcript_74975/g.160542 Transcript_74975/m.160542 type:complete len:229 (+) Transcript_74975:623-1309(+)